MKKAIILSFAAALTAAAFAAPTTPTKRSFGRLSDGM